MHQALAIITLVLAAALALLDATVLRTRRHESIVLSRSERLTHGVFMIALALMALSSIVMLAIGQSMHGWMLILHMSIAPLFCIAISVLAVQWANWSSALLRLVLLSALATIVSALFMMMTWFGSEWQRLLLNTHRISSMVLLVAAVAQAARLLLTRSVQHAARAGD